MFKNQLIRKMNTVLKNNRWIKEEFRPSAFASHNLAVREYFAMRIIHEATIVGYHELEIVGTYLINIYKVNIDNITKHLLYWKAEFNDEYNCIPNWKQFQRYFYNDEKWDALLAEFVKNEFKPWYGNYIPCELENFETDLKEIGAKYEYENSMENGDHFAAFRNMETLHSYGFLGKHKQIVSQEPDSDIINVRIYSPNKGELFKLLSDGKDFSIIK